MHCEKFTSGECRSCDWLDLSYAEQLVRKQAQVLALLALPPSTQLLAPVPSMESAFRNKAKMVVSGTVDQPILGIIDSKGLGTDLSDCPLYPPSFAPVFVVLKQFIRKAQLTPYHILKRKGELKAILLTQGDEGWMLRFVLRSEHCVNAMRLHLPWLQQQLPQLLVISVNLQPVAMAVLEGEQEIVLTPSSSLRITSNGLPLYLRPKSFLQTNPLVAAELYATAKAWTQAWHVKSEIKTVWDLFCGVGGFGLHCTPAGATLTGIEISSEAIASAQQSALELGLNSVNFMALDAAQFVAKTSGAPDLLIVNPPRRGIGASICQWLNELQPKHIIYSSCNAETLASDLKLLGTYAIEQVQLFDMFPHTHHYETLVALSVK